MDDIDEIALKNSIVATNLRKAIRDAQSTPSTLVPSFLLSKGDTPGHEFRGNQYTTGGSGAGGDKETANRKGEARNAHDVLTSHGFTRNPKGDESEAGMKFHSYTDSKGREVSVDQKDGSSMVHDSNRRLVGAFDSAKGLDAHLKGSK